MKRQVKDILGLNGLRELVTIRPESPVVEALKLLIQWNCSALLVVKNNILKGVFSEKDFVKSSLENENTLFAKVEQIMTSQVYYVEPDFTLEECLQIMSKVHIRHLPVVDRGVPIAMISMRHIMEVLVSDKENQIRELTTYISGPSAVIEFEQNKTKFDTLQLYSTQKKLEII